MSSRSSKKSKSPKNPPVVTLVSQLVGHQRTMPCHGGYVTEGELRSLHARLQRMIVLAANMADTVDRIRCRLAAEQPE